MAGLRAYFSKDAKLLGNSKIELCREESHHLIKVHRIQPGNSVQVFDGQGKLWKTTFLGKKGSRAELQVEEAVDIPVREGQVVLAQALVKAKAFDLIIRQATELGVSKIIPLITENSEIQLDASRQKQKLKRWREIAIEACKQCGNFWVPEIAPIEDLKSWASSLSADKMRTHFHFVASLEKEAKHLEVMLQEEKSEKAKSATWVVGPEGDFSPSEYALLREKGVRAVSLSKNVLRVETATLYALSVWDYWAPKRTQ